MLIFFFFFELLSLWSRFPKCAFGGFISEQNKIKPSQELNWTKFCLGLGKKVTGREVTEGPVGDELPVSQHQTFSPAALWRLLLIMWLPADREDRYLHNKEIYLIKKFRQHFLKDKAERICSFVQHKSFKSKFFNQLCTTAVLYRQTNKRLTYFHTACPQSQSLVCWGEKKKPRWHKIHHFKRF